MRRRPAGSSDGRGSVERVDAETLRALAGEDLPERKDFLARRFFVERDADAPVAEVAQVDAAGLLRAGKNVLRGFAGIDRDGVEGGNRFPSPKPETWRGPAARMDVRADVRVTRWS